MKKIFIITILICSIIFIPGCSQNKQNNQENNSAIVENNQDDNSSAAQDNSNSQTTAAESTNSQSDTSKKKDNDTNITKTNRKEYYTKKLDDIQAKIDKDYDFKNAETTADMRNLSGMQYKLWDDSLNEIYKDLQNTLSSNDREKLTQEELTWISKKENDAKNSANEVKGGTLEPVYYSLSLADSTKKRCYELVNKYM